MILLAAFVISTWLMRRHLEDDTFIHLRYAANLDDGRGLVFNAGQRSFGSSSLIWTYLLALVGELIPRGDWPAMAKVASVLFHGAGVAVAYFATVRSRWWSRTAVRDQWVMMVGLILLLASPSAARWLQDGMETGLVVLACLSAAAVCASRLPQSRWAAVGAGVLVALPSVARVDLLTVTLVAIVVLAFRWQRGALLAGGVAAAVAVGWVGITLLLEGHLVSDAGLAKETKTLSPMFAVKSVEKAASAGPLWLVGGLAVVVCLALARRRREFLLPVAAALPVVATLAAGALVGQYTESRYMFGPLIFLLALSVAALAQQSSPARLSAVLAGVALVAGLSAAVLTARDHYAMGRSPHDAIARDAFEPGERVGAVDIGELGWYAPVVVEDFAGLVNGRDVAQIRDRQARFCANSVHLGVPDALVVPPDAGRIGITPGADRVTYDCGDQGLITYQDTQRVVLRLDQQLGTPASYSLWQKV